MMATTMTPQTVLQVPLSLELQAQLPAAGIVMTVATGRPCSSQRKRWSVRPSQLPLAAALQLVHLLVWRHLAAAAALPSLSQTAAHALSRAEEGGRAPWPLGPHMRTESKLQLAAWRWPAPCKLREPTCCSTAVDPA